MTDEPLWVKIARSYIGVTEIPGVATSPSISRWLRLLNAWWVDDETPWCGVFVAECMREAGIELPKNWMRAKSWLDWGVPITTPVLGCVAVYGREGGGHVNFVVGRDSTGRIMGLGGNQRNQVNISPFLPMGVPGSRVIGYRVPLSVATPSAGTPLPILASDGQPLSSNEA